MAITNIAKSLKLRLPRRQKSHSFASAVPAGGGGGITPPKATTKEDEFRQVFRYLDTNNDGGISAEELRDYFVSIGDTVSYEEAKKIIREFSNAEDSLLLEFEGFVRMMEIRGDVDEDKLLKQAFEVYEVEKGSGCITPEGLRQVLRRLGDVKSYRECEDMIRVFDLDGNGVLDFYEFQKMMT